MLPCLMFEEFSVDSAFAYAGGAVFLWDEGLDASYVFRDAVLSNNTAYSAGRNTSEGGLYLD